MLKGCCMLLRNVAEFRNHVIVSRLRGQGPTAVVGADALALLPNPNNPAVRFGGFCADRS